jgi:hypothetical protein
MKRALVGIRSLGWLPLKASRTATHGIHQPSGSTILRSASARHRDLMDTNNTSIFYIGVGDQFDDERRLVREKA